ncbi:MAG TPA: hypothetical protein DEA08_16555, partial [Planctomycetes bacterium]|nr:hypothetical protein [Planctomycetota bacterium]
LSEAGIQLLYHGDFDPAGLGIADLVIRRHGARPWRFRALDYLLSEGGTPLTPPAELETPWDPALAAALHAERRAVPEERLLEELLRDLAQEGAGTCAADPTGLEPLSPARVLPLAQAEESAAESQREGAPLHVAELLRGLRCPKRLWLSSREPTSPRPLNPWLARQRREVVAEARRAHPRGCALPEDLAASVPGTRAALAEGQRVLYGAAFERGGLIGRLDLLVARGAPSGAKPTWSLTRVTSASSITPEHVDALALGVWLAEGSGLEVEQAWVAHVDTAATDPAHRLRWSDETRAVRQRLRTLDSDIEASRHTLELPAPPALDVGPQCERGGDRACPYLERCWPDEGPTVFELPRFPARVAWRLHRQGRARLEDPADLPAELSARQRRLALAVLEGRQHFDRQALGEHLSAWPRPWASLDFETIAAALPRYPGARPYEPIPFQFSVHLETPSGLESRDYLHPTPDDPRPALAAQLVGALADHAGAVLVYGLGFEASRLEELACAVPALATELRAIRERLVDLRPLLEERLFDPRLEGSYGLKRVRPLLLGRTAIARILPPSRIDDGLAAQEAYAQLLQSDSTPEGPMAELRAYCCEDSASVLRIALGLRETGSD